MTTKEKLKQLQVPIPIEWAVGTSDTAKIEILTTYVSLLSTLVVDIVKILVESEE